MVSDSLTTPGAMIARARELDRVRRAAESELLQLAAAWADAHPDPDDRGESVRAGRVEPATLDGLGSEDTDEEPDCWRGVPRIAWDAAAAFGCAVGRSTVGAERMIRDALILRHRLPRHWAMVVDGSLEVFRARRVADLVAGYPDDVCDHIDEHVGPVAATAGLVTLDRKLEEAMLELHAEQVELDRLAALAARHVTVNESSLQHTGTGDLTAHADWADLTAFDATVSALAARLAEEDEAAGRPPESLDERRARALGILADPGRAKAMLDGSPERPTRQRRRADLLLELCTDAFGHRAFIGKDGRLDKTLLVDAIRDWCGRDDVDVHVHPYIDLEDHERVDRHDPPARMRARRDLAQRRCAFPYCNQSARRCDQDHCVPFDDGGATCDCNLVPLCRRHHRLKTLRGYRYVLLEPSTWLWRTPHGLRLVRDRYGTRDVTPDPSPTSSDPPWDGCLLSA